MISLLKYIFKHLYSSKSSKQ